MEKIVNFITCNSELCLLILTSLLEVVLILFSVFKKKKQPIEDVLSMIPAAISEVEKKIGAGNGSSKKEMVMALVLKWYEELTGVVLLPSSRYYKTFSSFIEEVLKAPQRKEK